MEDRTVTKQRMLMKMLGSRPVAFNPQLAKLCGSVKAGLLLSQLLYWTDRSDSEWFYKTIDEIEEETALSRKEQESAIRRLKQLGFIEVEVRGMPAKRYFKLDCPKVTSQFVRKLQTGLPKRDKLIYTENTTDRFSTNVLNGDKSPRVYGNVFVSKIKQDFIEVTGLKSSADKYPERVAWNFHRRYGADNFRPALEYLTQLWKKDVTKIETVKLHYPTYQKDVLKQSNKELTSSQKEIAELYAGRDQ